MSEQNAGPALQRVSMTRDEVVISESKAAEAALTKLHAAAEAAAPEITKLLRSARKAHAALLETQAAYHPSNTAAFALDRRQLAEVVLGPNASQDPRDALRSLIANAVAGSRDSGQPGWSKAGVKALLVERQVLLHLSRAIVDLAQHPGPALADATSSLLQQLLYLLSCLHLSVDRLPQNREAAGFASKLRSQLTESGLLRQLPQLAGKATAQLAADQQQQQQQLQQPQSADRKQLETRAMLLSGLYGELLSHWANDTSPFWTDVTLWQDTTASSVASTFPAGCRLAVATLQYVSTQLQQLQQRQPSMTHAARLSDLVSYSLEFLGSLFIAMSWSLTGNNQLMPAAARLLRDACCVPALALVCAVSVQLQHLDRTKLGGSSGTAQQEDGEVHADMSARAWRQVSSTQSGGELLPAGILEQLQTALGVSGVGLARAAGVLAARSPFISGRLAKPLGLFGILRLYRAMPVAALESHAAAEVHHHLLLALLMTVPCPAPAATGSSSSSRDSANASSSSRAAASLVPCRVGAAGGSRALKAWLHTTRRAGLQHCLQLSPTVAQALMSGVELLLTDILQQLTQGSEAAALTNSSGDDPAAQLSTSGPLLGHAAASAVAMLQCVVGFLQFPCSRDTQAAVQEAWAAAAPRLARLLEALLRFEGRNAALLAATQGGADSCFCLLLLGSLIVPRRLEPVVDPVPQQIGGAGSGLLLVPRRPEPPVSAWGLLLEAAVAAGPGSAQQQQLLGLLTTGLKLQRVILQAGGTPWMDADEPENSFFYKQVSDAALKVLQAWGSSIEVAAAADMPTPGAAAADVEAMLPWLALLGRCCSSNADAITVPVGEEEAEMWIAKSCQRLLGVACAVDAIASMLLPEAGASPHEHVAVGGHAAARVLLPRLASLGVDVAALQQHAADARDAAQTAHGMMTSAADAIMRGRRPLRRLLPRRLLQPGGKLPVALQALSAALGAVPCRTTCNAPRCVSLGGSTEQQLVKGTGKVCGGCHTVRYCCKPCQHAHWGAGHKVVCRALQAAAATADSSEPADDGQAGADSSVGAPA